MLCFPFPALGEKGTEEMGLAPRTTEQRFLHSTIQQINHSPNSATEPSHPIVANFASHFKCPLRDIIVGEGMVIPAIHYWAKITKSLTGFLQTADY